MASDSEESDFENFNDVDDVAEVNDGDKKEVMFDGDGKPIGPHSIAFSSYLGELSRTDSSVAYEKWKLVQTPQKKMIWREIRKEYDVSSTSRKIVLGKANDYWRKFKCVLRKVYDEYHTDDERKSHCPTCVKQEDWEAFVDTESTDVAKARQSKGKKARGAVKTEQRSGRRGAARTTYEMRQREPYVPVTRTSLYIAIHTGPNDETCNNATVEKIKTIASTNPRNTFFDLDHDPVTQVYGTGSKYYLHGLGSGVTKRGLLDSAPARRQLKKQKVLTSALGDEVLNLKSIVQEHSRYISELKAGQVPSRHCSSSPTAPEETVQNTRVPDSITTDWIEKGCKLLSIRGDHVYNGRALMGVNDTPDEDFPHEDIETYDIFLDRVIKPNAASTDKETLGEEPIGSIIRWPKAMVVFVS